MTKKCSGGTAHTVTHDKAVSLGAKMGKRKLGCTSLE